jgi:hypothetical protein
LKYGKEACVALLLINLVGFVSGNFLKERAITARAQELTKEVMALIFCAPVE